MNAAAEPVVFTLATAHPTFLTSQLTRPLPNHAWVEWAKGWHRQATANRHRLLRYRHVARLPHLLGTYASTAAWKHAGMHYRSLAGRYARLTNKLAREARARAARAHRGICAAVSGSPLAIGHALAAACGWVGAQWNALYSLWMRESNWNPNACNSSSGAYGIPQALPGSKMAAAGADWARNAATQIRWGISYIRSSYGSPVAAWAHELAYGWY